MKTYTSTNGKFTCIAPVDESSTLLIFAYLNSNSIIDIQSVTNASTVFRFTAIYNGVGYAAEYVSDTKGRLRVPLKKWIVRAGAGNYIALYIQATITGTSETVIIPMNVVAGMSYNDVLSPLSKEVDDMLQGRLHRTIIPPNVIISDDTFIPSIVTESSWDDIAQNDPVGGQWDEWYGGTPSMITTAGDRKNEIEVHCKADALTYNDGTRVKRWRLTKPDPCGDLVCVQWLSQTGATRRHLFPFFNIERAVDSAVSLMTAGDGYLVEKNVSNGFTIRLQGLTPYSYWYYSDMLLSSDIHAAIDAATAGNSSLMASEITAVYVEGASLVTPSGSGFYTFELKLKYKHYDNH